MLSVFGLGQRRGSRSTTAAAGAWRFVAAGAYLRSVGERLVISTDEDALLRGQRELTPPRGAVPG
jgi:hypothetical protein